MAIFLFTVDKSVGSNCGQVVQLSYDLDRGYSSRGHGEGQQHANRLQGDQDGLVDPDAGEVLLLLVRNVVRLGHVGQHEHAAGLHGTVGRQPVPVGDVPMDSEGVGEPQGADQADPIQDHVEQPPPLLAPARSRCRGCKRAPSFKISHKVTYCYILI